MPGTLVESHGDLGAAPGRAWRAACKPVAWLALAVVGGGGGRRHHGRDPRGAGRRGATSIEIVHGLGATDGYIAGRFAAPRHRA